MKKFWLNWGRFWEEMNLEGHSPLCDRADLDTTFASLKSVYLKPKSNLHVGYI